MLLVVFLSELSVFVFSVMNLFAFLVQFFFKFLNKTISLTVVRSVNGVSVNFTKLSYTFYEQFRRVYDR